MKLRMETVAFDRNEARRQRRPGLFEAVGKTVRSPHPHPPGPDRAKSSTEQACLNRHPLQGVVATQSPVFLRIGVPPHRTGLDRPAKLGKLWPRARVDAVVS